MSRLIWLGSIKKVDEPSTRSLFVLRCIKRSLRILTDSSAGLWGTRVAVLQRTVIFRCHDMSNIEVTKIELRPVGVDPYPPTSSVGRKSSYISPRQEPSSCSFDQHWPLLADGLAQTRFHWRKFTTIPHPNPADSQRRFPFASLPGPA